MAEIWIVDPEGNKARVHTTEARTEYVLLHGWTDTTEAVGQEFQHVRNTIHGGRGVLNHEAALLHKELGWVPCGPPGYDDPAPAGTKPKPKTATSGANEE